MTQYKIDKGIPLPRARNEARYPLGDLEVGDSFFIPAKDEAAGEEIWTLPKLRYRVSCAVASWNKRHATKIKCTWRMEKDGLRVWRIR